MGARYCMMNVNQSGIVPSTNRIKQYDIMSIRCVNTRVHELIKVSFTSEQIKWIPCS